jgi:4-hydroxybenzoyl-CoA thioesterase
VHCRFLLPARFGDDVLVESTVTEFRRSSFDLHHRLSIEENLAAEGFETRVWVKGQPAGGVMKASPLPKQVIEALSRTS